MDLKLKLLVFLFVPLKMQKVQKLESINIQSEYETLSKREQTNPVCLHAVEKYEKVNTQNDYKTTINKQNKT